MGGVLCHPKVFSGSTPAAERGGLRGRFPDRQFLGLRVDPVGPGRRQPQAPPGSRRGGSRRSAQCLAPAAQPPSWAGRARPPKALRAPICAKYASCLTAPRLGVAQG